MNAEMSAAKASEALTAEQIEIMRRSYELNFDKCRFLAEEVVFILEDEVAASKVKIHSIEKRVKTFPSIVEKCKKYDLSDLSSIKDVVGVRVVCLFKPDLATIDKIVRKSFDIVELDDKTSESNDPLGYASIHYICEMPKRYVGPRYSRTSGMLFEIQVRTLCMHCWAAVSHHLDYKGDWDVPADLKQALNALGGLFFVADREFQQFNGERLKYLEKASARLETAPAEEINLDTLTAYLKKKFPKRRGVTPQAVSDLVQETKRADYKTIKELDSDIDRALPIAEQFEKETQKEGYFYATGITRIALDLASEKFFALKGSSPNDYRKNIANYRKRLRG